jgi:hypothetical protein
VVRIRAAVFADISGIAAMVESYWHLEAIGGFERRSVESTLAALLSYPKHGAGWVADNEGTLCAYLTAVYMMSGAALIMNYLTSRLAADAYGGS